MWLILLKWIMIQEHTHTFYYRRNRNITSQVLVDFKIFTTFESSLDEIIFIEEHHDICVSNN